MAKNIGCSFFLLINTLSVWFFNFRHFVVWKIEKKTNPILQKLKPLLEILAHHSHSLEWSSSEQQDTGPNAKISSEFLVIKLYHIADQTSPSSPKSVKCPFLSLVLSRNLSGHKIGEKILHGLEEQPYRRQLFPLIQCGIRSGRQLARTYDRKPHRQPFR